MECHVTFSDRQQQQQQQQQHRALESPSLSAGVGSGAGLRPGLGAGLTVGSESSSRPIRSASFRFDRKRNGLTLSVDVEPPSQPKYGARNNTFEGESDDEKLNVANSNNHREKTEHLDATPRRRVERKSSSRSRGSSRAFDHKHSDDYPANRILFLLGGDDTNLVESHDLFCEMCELITDAAPQTIGKLSKTSNSSSFAGGLNEQCWAECARWIKFEEDVEDGGERWSKPHVATLSLHSLFELRSCFLNGLMLLGCEASTFEQLVETLVDKWVSSRRLPKDKREQVRSILLLRHVHLSERHHKQSGVLPIIKSIADIASRKHSTAVRNDSHDHVPGESHGRNSVSSELDKSTTASASASTSADHNHSGPKRRSASFGQSSSNHPYHNDHGVSAQSETESLAHVGCHGDTATSQRTRRAATERSISTTASAGGAGTGTGNEQSTVHVSFIQGDHGDDESASSHHYYDSHFLKKIPAGSEVANVLVGEMDGIPSPLVAFVRLSKASFLGDLSEVPLPNRFVFVLIGPTENQNKHREIGRSIGTLMTDSVFRDISYRAQSREDLLIGIDEFLSNVIVLPPGEWDPSIRIEPPPNVPSQEGRKNGSSLILPNQLQERKRHELSAHTEGHLDPVFERTHRAFGGLINDVKARLPYYPSDFTDAFHIQCVASSVFLYFAALAPLITFGGLLGEATKNYMATAESLVAAAICGTAYALFAGQPLTILSSTGPVLVFEQIVFEFAEDNNVDYLSFRCWIGLWSALFIIALVALDVSAYVRYITRFTEESFACLVSLIFVYEALRKMFEFSVSITASACSANDTNTTNLTLETETVTQLYAGDDVLPQLQNTTCVKATREGNDVHYFSLLLFLMTFLISWELTSFRNSRFFPIKVRSTIADFAVVLAIAVVSVADQLVGVPTAKLHVPDSLRPTRATDRGWFVELKLEPAWLVFAAIPPAILAVILIFMDQQITSVIVNRKEHMLKKPPGYHLDLLVLAVLVTLCSLTGLPWLVASTVHSVNNVMSLKRMSKCNAPGEAPRFLGCREQRLTVLLIHIVIGLSIFLTSFLAKIPMAVLYGVFLYMGVSSLSGMDFVSRCAILFMPQKYQPDTLTLRHVPLRRVHLFTFLQAICISGMWYIKTIKYVSIIFPLLVLAMCFVRKAMDYIFTQPELRWLDDILPGKVRKEEQLETVHSTHEYSESMSTTVLNSMSSDMNKMNAFGAHAYDACTSKQSVQLADGSRLNDFCTINMTEEVSKTTIWKQLVGSVQPRERCLSGSSNEAPSNASSRRGSKKKNGSELPTPTSPTDANKFSLMARVLNYRRRTYTGGDDEQIELNKSTENAENAEGGDSSPSKQASPKEENALHSIRRKLAAFRVVSQPQPATCNSFAEEVKTPAKRPPYIAVPTRDKKDNNTVHIAAPTIVVDSPSGGEMNDASRMDDSGSG